MTDNLEHKSFDFEASISTITDEGVFEGYCSTFGNVDRANEVVVKGAFRNLDSFLKDGFVALNHDWNAAPIATIEDISEDDRGLKVVARFHSTEQAQEVRKIILERMDRGKSVGLSIGYVVTDDEYTQDGIRLLKGINLFEFSVVTVPCNPHALVTQGKTLSDQTAETLTVVEDLANRFKELAELRKSQNRRPLGTKAVETVAAVVEALEKVHDELQGLLDEAAPKQSEDIEEPLEESAPVEEAVEEIPLADPDRVRSLFQEFLEMQSGE